jgi:succinyl-CoA synthetase beta subunit
VSTIDVGVRDQQCSTPMQSSADIATLIAAARAQRRSMLTEPEAKAFLRAQGICVPPGRVVRSADEAPAAVDVIGAPVVVKAVAHELSHKTDAGAVMFPIDSAAAAQAACRTITARVAAYRPDIMLEGFLVEAYRPAQPEWILALRNDPHFGPVVMFGLGGIYVETLRQVSFRLAPLRSEDIEALLSERPAMRLLSGARGAAPSNRRAVVDVLRRLSELSMQPSIMREISEIEINPLAVTETGALALDALIVLRS